MLLQTVWTSSLSSSSDMNLMMDDAVLLSPTGTVAVGMREISPPVVLISAACKASITPAKALGSVSISNCKDLAFPYEIARDGSLRGKAGAVFREDVSDLCCGPVFVIRQHEDDKTCAPAGVTFVNDFFE